MSRDELHRGVPDEWRLARQEEAGALGVPVWVALSKLSWWRWLSNREDSPWYPTMRLFRQERPGEWGAASQRVAEAVQPMQREKEAQRPCGSRISVGSIRGSWPGSAGQVFHHVIKCAVRSGGVVLRTLGGATRRCDP